MIILPPNIERDIWDSTNEYLSKTRISLFDTCQIKYKKQYVDKILPREDTHATSIGSRYHNFMETFMGMALNYPVDIWMSFIHPDFTDEERPLLEWAIQREINRYITSPKYWKPIALEYQIVDHTNKLRGIIDRIDQIDETTIEVLEYKTSKKHYKSKLQLEFGFYDILLDCVPELKNFKRKYTVLYPRLRQEYTLNPSRRSTIMKRVETIRNAIETGNFSPSCTYNDSTCTCEYALPFCTICTMEEIAEYNKVENLIRS